MTFAVIETGGKQHKVKEGGKLRVEKIEGSPSEKVKFDKVLLKTEKDGVSIGQPYLKGVYVEAEIMGQGRTDKKIVFRYHSKTRYRKKKTHRQNYTEVKVLKIS